MPRATVDDDCLKALVEERLHEDPELDASAVTVSVHRGKITLEGAVENPRIRKLIEEVGEQFGDEPIDSELRSL